MKFKLRNYFGWSLCVLLSLCAVAYAADDSAAVVKPADTNTTLAPVTTPVSHIGDEFSCKLIR